MTYTPLPSNALFSMFFTTYSSVAVEMTVAADLLTEINEGWAVLIDVLADDVIVHPNGACTFVYAFDRWERLVAALSEDRREYRSVATQSTGERRQCSNARQAPRPRYCTYPEGIACEHCGRLNWTPRCIPADARHWLCEHCTLYFPWSKGIE